uniref:Uncharacterized protein n=1 Tax=Cacopsylla melanoneura TaxID=428564 RepID=A0A8D9E6A4_9HEMI
MLSVETVNQLKGIIQSEIRETMGAEMIKLDSKLDKVLGDMKTEISNSVDARIQEKTQEMNKHIEEKFKKQETMMIDERKRRNLIIYGLGTLRGWRERETAVFSLFEDTMGVSCRNGDVDSILSLNRNREDGPILVKFTTNRKKLEILLNRKKLKETKIYIDEDFTKEIVQKRKELKVVMKQLKQEGKRNVYLKQDQLWVDGVRWTEEGGATTKNKDDEDIDMEMSEEEKSKSKDRRKRARSPTEVVVDTQTPRRTKKNSQLVAQTKISNFFNKNLDQRPRASSAGNTSLGPEITKIVDKLTSKDPQNTTEGKNQDPAILPQGTPTEEKVIPSNEENNTEAVDEKTNGTEEGKK